MDGHRRPAGDQVGLPSLLAPEPSMANIGQGPTIASIHPSEMPILRPVWRKLPSQRQISSCERTRRFSPRFFGETPRKVPELNIPDFDGGID
jgi:hypothetical protein